MNEQSSYYFSVVSGTCVSLLLKINLVFILRQLFSQQTVALRWPGILLEHFSSDLSNLQQ